jgi:hypothetical protein
MGYYGLGVRADISSRCSAGFLVAWRMVVQEAIVKSIASIMCSDF